jgi:sugar lactone lactonase YvrE
MADLRDVAAGLDWMVTHTSSSIANFSFGHAENLDDDADAQLFDYYADAYDLSVAVAAGNAGSGSLRLTSPAIAYNVVSVGNWDTGGWPDNSHEVMNSTSSAGPTSNNRQKPDIAAPGTNIYSAAYNWDLNQGKNPDYVQATGTSVSAPHIAGALALLRDIAPAGQPAAPMVKALLLNTADTPGSAGGWLSGPGWGYVNLRTAWSQRSLLDLAELGGSSGAPKIRLYQVPLEGNQFRATAVWNRHVYEPSVDSTGNPTFSSWAVSGLAMGLYDPATANPIPGAGILFAQGNVEQLDVDLTAPHLANAILSVAWQSGSTSSAAPEPIALAFSSPFTPVTGPAFAVSCSAPPVVYLGAPFTVTCNVTNTGDFPALTVNGYIANASGMAGAVDLQFGNLQAGQTSSPGFAYMTAPLVAGDYPATIGAATDSWGGSFVGDTTVTVHVAPNPDWAPWLSCAGPSPIPTGSADVRLSVTGNSFIPGATVLWDGNALATTFIDNTSLTAIVPAAMLVTATTGGVSVANPSGTVSVTRSLTVPPPTPRTAGYIYTIAGNGSGCFADPTMGDGNPATSAQFNFPTAIAADRAGNIYVADPNDQRVRRIGQNGTITTFAGNRQFGYSGDGGLATAATFKGPGRMAADVAGNVYIVDSGNYIIRRVDAQGIISTYAGNGNSGYGGDGGPATSASLGNVGSLALDGAGNLYVADTANNRIRQVTPQGIISTCAGNGQPGYSGDSGKTTDGKLNAPTGVAADAAGNLFIADTGNNVIRKVTAGGVISTYAGGGTDPYTSGDGGPAVGAYMPQPVSVALDGQGNLFILDHGELRVRKVDTGGIISTYAGVIAGSGPLVEDVPATSAFLYGAQDIAVDAAGNLYVVQAATGLQTGSGVARVVPAAGAGSSLPFVTSLDPPLATAGGDALILTVSGENFAADSRVNWDEGTLRTTYLNPTTLSAAVPADVLAVTGTHTIVVQSSTPGATLSNTLLFFVQPFPSGLPTIVASPNPVPVPYYPDGGATTLTWNAPGHNHVAINSDIGLHLVSSGGPSGSVRTPSDTGYPQTFFLTDTDTNQMLASVTVNMLIVSNKIGVPEQPNRGRNPKAEAVTGGQQPTGAYR